MRNMHAENLQLIMACATISYLLIFTKLHSNIVCLKINLSFIPNLNSELVSEVIIASLIAVWSLCQPIIESKSKHWQLTNRNLPWLYTFKCSFEEMNLKLLFYFATGMRSLPVHRLGGAEEGRKQTELLRYRGVFCLQGEFSFNVLIYFLLS